MIASGAMPSAWGSVAAERTSHTLQVAVALSLALHGILLSVHFTFPDALRRSAANTVLEVILVNAKTAEKPAKTQALAQVNLDRGGNTDQEVRAKTPLPVINPQKPGSDLAAAQRRVRELEAKQRELLARAKAEAKAKPPPVTKSRIPVPAEPQATETPADKPAQAEPDKPTGRDLADLSLAAIRLQAQIDRQLSAYQKRPRKKFLGASATEYRFAQYEEDWRQKVERVGTLNYPPEARGRLYGNLQLTVTLKPNGEVAAIDLNRSSGLKVLDQAAFKIVRMSSPFAPFPANIRRDTDLLVITRTWFFGRGDTLWTDK